MKVFQLIKELEKHNPDLEVALFNEDDRMRRANDVELTEGVDGKTKSGYKAIFSKSAEQDHRGNKIIEKSEVKYLLIG